MIAKKHTFIGTWDEILKLVPDFEGEHLNVTITLDDSSTLIETGLTSYQPTFPNWFSIDQSSDVKNGASSNKPHVKGYMLSALGYVRVHQASDGAPLSIYSDEGLNQRISAQIRNRSDGVNLETLSSFFRACNLQLTDLDYMEYIPKDEAHSNFLTTLESIRDAVPESSWDKLPADYIMNLDKYLYSQDKITKV